MNNSCLPLGGCGFQMQLAAQYFLSIAFARMCLSFRVNVKHVSNRGHVVKIWQFWSRLVLWSFLCRQSASPRPATAMRITNCDAIRGTSARGRGSCQQARSLLRVPAYIDRSPTAAATPLSHTRTSYAPSCPCKCATARGEDITSQF